MAGFQFSYSGAPIGPEIAPSTMDAVSIQDFLRTTVIEADDVHIILRSNSQDIYIGGTGLTYSSGGQLTGGVIDRININTGGRTAIMSFFKIPATQAWDWLVRGATQQALTTIYSGDDSIFGTASLEMPDLLRGFAGNDSINGFGGSDSLFGGAGDDTIIGNSVPVIPSSNPPTFLRGEEGNDSILGGGGFDDIHGNQGNDTAAGGRGDDWVVGGQHNDLLYGEEGRDIVYGNMGNDTLYGDKPSESWRLDPPGGADTLRGAQGDDSIQGDGGDDLIWGDRGNDTISGGAGADTFVIFAGGGIDKILDFSAGQGDRVVVENGSAYTIRQAGADAVIDLGGGDQMILVGVSTSSLPAGWIS